MGAGVQSPIRIDPDATLARDPGNLVWRGYDRLLSARLTNDAYTLALFFEEGEEKPSISGGPLGGDRYGNLII